VPLCPNAAADAIPYSGPNAFAYDDDDDDDDDLLGRIGRR